ncbi:uncharacterized protein [Macrobrachium rosenbergii]|uniref:uncharacterized protein n=1 Tax=Macrobrachium rosenbergii TaxID=79674 RepID=UPI0034D79599
MHVPSTQKQWKEAARGFEQRWNFPHTLGAIDGNHIRFQNPPFGGTHYYKKFYFIILLGTVDAEYKFLFVDEDAIGSESDGGPFAKTQLCKMLDRHEANLPGPERLPNKSEDKPLVDYFFFGDDTSTLKKCMMKSYQLLHAIKITC